jgi:hypothetical protein
MLVLGIGVGRDHVHRARMLRQLRRDQTARNLLQAMPRCHDQRAELARAVGVLPHLRRTDDAVVDAGDDEVLPTKCMQRLATLVPRPRLHLIRFHGVLALNAKLRPLVVPQGPVESAPGSVARRVRGELCASPPGCG